VTEIRVERQGPVAHVILDRPGKLNALRPEALSVLQATVRELDSDRSVRVVVLSGAGRAFCTGVDLGTVDDVAGVGALSAEIALQMQDTLAAIENSAVPWIAAVHGLACAGGLELTLACDVVVAAEGTRLGDFHARYGLFPGGGASQRLPRLVGERRARWLLLSGDWIDAAKAARWGLVTGNSGRGPVLQGGEESRCRAERGSAFEFNYPPYSGVSSDIMFPCAGTVLSRPQIRLMRCCGTALTPGTYGTCALSRKPAGVPAVAGCPASPGGAGS
jgi:enoyl-CoA hydratase/carnithine racemase